MTILLNVFLHLLEMSMVASLVGLVVLLLQKLLQKKISPRYTNILWIAFLVSLLNPFRLESSFNVYSLLGVNDMVDKFCEQVENLMAGSSTSSIKENTMGNQGENFIYEYSNTNDFWWETVDFSFLDGTGAKESWLTIKRFMAENPIIAGGIFIGTFVYFVGAIGCMIRSIAYQIKFCRQTQKCENERLYRILEECINQLQIKKKVELVCHEMVGVPSILGIRHPKIYVNSALNVLEDKEIKLVFLHELSHYKNGDLLKNKVIQFLKTIYWYHPVVQILCDQWKKDLEFANDEFVLQQMPPKSVKEYCKTLLKVISLSGVSTVHGKVNFSLSMTSKPKELERRIKKMKLQEGYAKNKIVVFISMLVLVCVITVCFATNDVEHKQIEKVEQADSELQEEVENKNVSSESLAEKLSEKLGYPLEKEATVSRALETRIHPITNEKITHNGVDLVYEDIRGENVLATYDGQVIFAEYDSSYGNTVVLAHKMEDTVFYSRYCHLSEMEVEKGDTVEKGQTIGKVGATGMATGAFLHFEILDLEKVALDPMELLSE